MSSLCGLPPSLEKSWHSLTFLYFICLPSCWEGVVVKWGARDSQLVTSTWAMEAGSRVAQLVCSGRKHAGLYSTDCNADTEEMPPFTIYTSGLCVHTNRSTTSCNIQESSQNYTHSNFYIPCQLKKDGVIWNGTCNINGKVNTRA